ncbi:flagellar biosynthetic protein FliO [Ralstonia pseudosolanacearum]|uniref:flagellar biosynthetic protein FliO n=1 Tax=Ralstonia pseudosolanacearum TaxID=1310165 RepID=UPI003D047DED
MPVDTKAGPERLPASIPLRRDAEQDSAAMFGAPQLLMAVAILAALLWGLSRRIRSRGSSSEGRPAGWLDRFAGRPGNDAARIVSASRLTGKASLHVVEWDGQQWLLGCTEHTLSVLAKRPVGTDGTSDAMRAIREEAEHG